MQSMLREALVTSRKLYPHLDAHAVMWQSWRYATNFTECTFGPEATWQFAKCLQGSMAQFAKWLLVWILLTTLDLTRTCIYFWCARIGLTYSGSPMRWASEKHSKVSLHSCLKVICSFIIDTSSILTFKHEYRLSWHCVWKFVALFVHSNTSIV